MGVRVVEVNRSNLELIPISYPLQVETDLHGVIPSSAIWFSEEYRLKIVYVFF